MNLCLEQVSKPNIGQSVFMAQTPCPTLLLVADIVFC